MALGSKCLSVCTTCSDINVINDRAVIPDSIQNIHDDVGKWKHFSCLLFTWSCFLRISTLPRVHIHYSDVTWASRHEQLNCLFNSFFGLTAEIMQGSELYWPFVWGESTDARWIPLQCGKRFHAMMSTLWADHVVLNSLRPSDAILWQGSRSTLVQLMACCLTAPSHYLNHYWLITNEVHKLTWNHLTKTLLKSPRGQWVNN